MKFSQPHLKLVFSLLFIGIVGKGFAVSSQTLISDKKVAKTILQSNITSIQNQLSYFDSEINEDDSSDSDSLTFDFYNTNFHFNTTSIKTLPSFYQRVGRVVASKLYIHNCTFLI